MPVVSSSDSRQCAILAIIFLILFLGIFVLGVFFPVFMMMVVFATLGWHVHRDRQNRRGQDGTHHQHIANQQQGQGNALEDAQQNATERGIHSPESPSTCDISFQMANTAQKQNYLKENLPLGHVLKTSKHQIHAIFGERIIGMKDHACPICLVDFEQGENIRTSLLGECDHVFHERCIVDWLSTTQGATCPCCRQSFVPDGLRFNPHQSNDTPTTTSTLPRNSLFPDHLSTIPQRVEYLQELVYLGVVERSDVESESSPDQLRAVLQGRAAESFVLPQSDICRICEAHLEPSQQIAVSPNPSCQHVFHRQCILRTLAESTDCTCPQCHRVFVNGTGDYGNE